MPPERLITLLAQLVADGELSEEEAATILRRIRTLCVAGRKPEEFRQFLEEVRTTHRAKRSLMAILDRRL